MKKFVCLLALFVFFVSCKKEKHDTICVNGHIEWSGDPAADGTGWVLVEDNEATPKIFVLTDVPNTFQVSGLSVYACVYETHERVICFCSADTIRYKYAIASIKKK